MRILDLVKEWTAVIVCRGTGFDEYGCGKSLLADRGDLRFYPRTPGVLFVVCPCGARNIVHVPEELKDEITHTVRWCEASNGVYRLMAMHVDPSKRGAVH